VLPLSELIVSGRERLTRFRCPGLTTYFLAICVIVPIAAHLTSYNFVD
jgi:hypothetical protein